jgi:hypothetical protein
MESQSEIVSRWSLPPGAPVDPAERVYVCFDDARVDEAVKRARSSGGLARIVCRGVREMAGVVVTELDAYLPDPRDEVTAATCARFDAWLHEVFQEAAAVLAGSAAHRLGLDVWFEQEAVLVGVRAVHGERFEVLARGSARPSRWDVLRAAIESLALRTVERIRTRAVRAAVARLPKGEAATWWGVIGDWPRSSRHVLSAMRAEPRGGVLLQNGLRTGLRATARAEVVEPGHVLPALQGLDGLPVEQCVEADVLLPLVLPWWRAVWRAYRRMGEAPFVRDARAMALLLTRDQWRAAEVRVATEAFLRRARPQRIEWSHASLVADAAADAACRAAGVYTVERMHGALYAQHELAGVGRTAVCEAQFWTPREAQVARRFVAATAGAPARFAEGMPAKKRDGPLTILLLTSYATSLTTGDANARPRRHYQRRIVREVLAVAKKLGARVVWRPHPADDETIVRADGAPELLPASAELADDLRAADVVVASVSTTIVEAALCLRPVVVHAIPAHPWSWLVAMVGEERLFRDEAELERAIAHVLSEPPETLRDHLFT